MKKLSARVVGSDKYLSVLVDDGIYGELVKHAWYVGRDGHVYRKVKTGKRRHRKGKGWQPCEAFYPLHRIVLGLERKGGNIVSNINGDKLDNRKKNLVLGKRRSGRSRKGKCEMCGNSFIAPGLGRKRRYCSNRCKDKRANGECTRCGRHFRLQKKGAKYCSKLCKKPKRCRSCGKTYVKGFGRAGEKFYCSRKCVPSLERACGWCGISFVWTKKRPNHCSERCQKSAHDHYRRIRDQARRAKKKSAFVEHVDAGRVYEMDGWRCHICCKKISKRKKYPDPESASLDHIVALTDGGLHQYGNVAAAHLRCNTSKGNRSFGQFRLISA